MTAATRSSEAAAVATWRDRVRTARGNDRSASRRAIELDLMTTKQHDDLPEDEDVTSADRLIVESPTMTGLIVARAFSPEPSLLPTATAALTGAQCRPQ